MDAKHDPSVNTLVTPLLNINTKLACGISLSSIEYLIAFVAYLKTIGIPFRINFCIEDQIARISNKRSFADALEEEKKTVEGTKRMPEFLEKYKYTKSTTKVAARSQLESFFRPVLDS